MKFTLIVPTKNEIVGMKLVMPRVPAHLFHQILVVDKDSTDRTVEYALQQGYEVHKQQLPGVRMCYLESYPKITGDVVVTFSPDGNSVPEALTDLVKKMEEGYDMVIVSRYLPPAKSYDDTLLTGIGNKVFTMFINLAFGGNWTDSMVMYRAYRRAVPDEMGLNTRRSPFYESVLGSYISWEPQLSARCARSKLKLGEIPGDEPPRVLDSKKAGGYFIPASRIYHYRTAVASLWVLIVDFFFFPKK